MRKRSDFPPEVIEYYKKMEEKYTNDPTVPAETMEYYRKIKKEHENDPEFEDKIILPGASGKSVVIRPILTPAERLARLNQIANTLSNILGYKVVYNGDPDPERIL